MKVNHLPRLLVTLLLLAGASFALGEQHQITLQPGDTLTVTVSGPATRPAGPTKPPAINPPLLVVTPADGERTLRVSLKDGPVAAPVDVYVRTKAKSAKVGTIAAGAGACTFAGSIDVPLADKWELWFWVVTAEGTAGVETRHQVQLGGNSDPPAQDLPPVRPEAPGAIAVPAGAVTVQDAEGLRTALAAGRPVRINGTIDLASTIPLPPRASIHGPGTLRRGGEKVYALEAQDDCPDVTISGVTFVGAGVRFAKSADRLIVDRSTFSGIKGGWPHAAIWLQNGRDGHITSNRFVESPNCDALIAGGYGDTSRTRITHNHFENVWQGIHFWEYTGDGLVFAYNTGRTFCRMGAELQGKVATNTLVEANDFRGWRDPYHGSFGLSIMNTGDGNVIRNNHMEDPSGKAALGIEASVHGGRCENNTVIGFNRGLAVVRGRDAKVEGNVIKGTVETGLWVTGGPATDQAPNGRISGNTIEGPRVFGIRISGGGHGGLRIESNSLIVPATCNALAMDNAGSGATFGDNEVKRK